MARFLADASHSFQGSRGEIDDSRMAASNTKESMMLYSPVTVNGEKLCYYEDVRHFVKTNDPHFYDTFGQLFPTPGALDDHDFNKSLNMLNGYEKPSLTTQSNTNSITVERSCAASFAYTQS